MNNLLDLPVGTRPNLSDLPLGTSPFFCHPFISYFTPPVISGKVVLDLGCGNGLLGCLLHGSRILKGTTLIGLEANEEYIKICKEHRSYNKIIKKALPNIPMKDQSVDVIFCIEVIEHLKKSDGLKLLREIDRVCRERAIITTPNVFFQPIEGRKNEDAHHSLWSTKDFRSFGYKVHGMGVRIPLVYKPNDPFIKIKQAMYYFFTPLSFIIPEIGGGLIAVKDFY